MSDLSSETSCENVRICREFEEAWRSDQHPRLEDYCDRAPLADRAKLFVELLRLDMKFRRLAGERPDWANYEERFPDRKELLEEVRLEGSETGTFHGQPGVTAGQRFEPIANIKMLGDYELIQEIGKGGMGIVYEARNTKLNKRVAIKLLPLAGMLSKSTRARFQNEAKAAAQLEHSHIVPVYAFGAEKGTHYYAMQYIEGNNLSHVITALREASANRQREGSKPSTRISDTTLPASKSENGVASNGASGLLAGFSAKGSTATRRHLESFARLGIQVADALQYAHDMGIVHRDIKPSNLLLDPHGDVWVADFGLAQIQGDPELTAPGDIVGTLRYMSPEQAYAKRVVVDHRTDIFSLGVTLYELLTLRQAFDGTTRTEIMRQVAFEDPPSPRKINSRLPDELATIIMKALAKSPDDRYQTAGELAADLRAWQKGEPIQARKPNLLQRAGKWARRHRAVVASASTSLAVVILAAFSVLAITVQTERQSKKVALAKNVELTAALRAAEGRRLVAQASLKRPHNPGLSSALAAEGAKLHPSPEANNSLLAALDANHERLVLHHHNVAVGTAGFSPDGRKAITTGSVEAFLGDPEPAYICDTETGQLLTTLKDDVTITSAVYGPLGNRILTTGSPSDAFARTADDLASHPPAVWDAARGVKVGVLKDAFLFHAHPAAFAPLGTRTLIVVPGRNNTARVYNAAGDQIMMLEGHEARVTFAGFSPNGKRIVTVSDDNTVRIWDVESGEEIQRFDWWKQRMPDEPRALVRSAVFSPDSKMLLTSSPVLGTDLWDLESRERRACGKGEAAIFSPNSELIALYDDVEARVLDARTLVTRFEMTGHERIVRRIVFSHDSRFVATCSQENSFGVWDVTKGTLVSRLRGHSRGVGFISFHPTGHRLISASRDQTARIWSLKSGAELAQFATEVFGHHPIVDFRPDSEQLLVTTKVEYGSSVWDLTQGTPLFSVPGQPAVPDVEQRHFITVTDDRVRVWDYQNGAEQASLTTSLGQFRTARVSPDGQLGAVVLEGGPTWIWNWRSGERIVLGESGGLDAIFHPSKREVVAFDKDSLARVWSSDNGKEIARLAHEGRARDIRYSSDGSRILVVTDRNAGYLFDAKTYEQLVTFGGAADRFNQGQFSSDGKRVLTYRSGGRTIYCWDAATGDGLRTLDSPAGRISIEMNSFSSTAVIAGDQGGLLIWDFESGQRRQLSADRYARASFVGDDQVIATSAQPWAQMHISRASTVGFRPATLEVRSATTGAVGNAHRLESAIVWMKNASRADRLLVGTRSYGVALFDPRTHQQQASFAAHAAPISYARFTPDGKKIVTCSWDQTVAVWDATTQQRLLLLVDHQSPILTATMGSDGKQLATGGRNGSVTLWDLEQGVRARTLEGLDAAIAQCSFGAFSARLVARTSAGNWRVWDTANGNIIDHDLEEDRVWSVEYAPGGSTLLVVPKTVDPTRHDVMLVPSQGQPIRLLHDSPGTARFGRRGQRVLTVTREAAFVWDAASGEKLLTLAQPGSTVLQAAFDSQGVRIITHHGNSITVWDETGKELLTVTKEIDFQPADFRDPFSPNGRWVAALAPNLRVRTIPLDPPDAAKDQVRSLTKEERTRFHVNAAFKK